MTDSRSHRMVVVPDVAASVSLRLAVPRSVPDGPALLSVDVGGATRTVPVLAVQRPEVPDGIIALSRDAYDDLGFDDAPSWSLRPRPAADATTLVLELSTERPPEAAAREIASGGLAGGLLLPTDDSDTDQWLEIGGASYRVRSAEVRDRGAALVRIGRQTRVDLFAPGVRAGVDIVILADISLSMDVDDIPAVGESVLALRTRGGHVRRIDALRQALRDLLNVRLQVSGRVSRVALLAFNDMTFPKFPSDGGMIELDADSSERVIDEYTKAVDGLRPFGATRIEVALHAAAELLYRHGHPNNERLIVLVSDGAHWTPGRDSDTGRVFEALDEPISLMEHLHRDMKVRLHAIGISTRELFLRHFHDDPSLTPDHRLLEQLVRVGGGDPARVGGLDVLVEYFAAVGGGMTHPVRGNLSPAAPLRLGPAATRTLADAARSAARSAVRSPTGGARRPDAVPERGEVLEACTRVNQRIAIAAGRVLPEALYAQNQVDRVLFDLVRDTGPDPERLTRGLHRMFNRLRPNTTGADALDCVTAWTALLDRLAASIAPPADLAELAAECGATETEPGRLLVAVLDRLRRGLDALAAGLEKAPPVAAAAVPAAPVIRPRSGGSRRTDPVPVGAGTDEFLKD